ncbi:MAG: DUF2127 domain-containing protein [Thermoleophilaceae bacterium]|nr:DUF2127 domain-containing protein [Thermoleophilaceae bacterium]
MSPQAHHIPPGVVHPERFKPRFHWELLVCGIRGHMLIGTGAAEIRPEDAVFCRAGEDGLRWHRCVRCDSWLPLEPPKAPTAKHAPDRNQIELPLRGRALRDKVILRLIAINRAFHFVAFGTLAAAIFVFAANQDNLRGPVFQFLAAVQGALGGPVQTSNHGLIYEIRHAFVLKTATLNEIGLVVSLYALIEGAEAVGLWYTRRWAEYLTFIATTALLPFELYELSKTVTPLKLSALIVNLAIVSYLIYAKRLFGLRGGGAVDEAERAHDVGWEALERTAPPHPGRSRA